MKKILVLVLLFGLITSSEAWIFPLNLICGGKKGDTKVGIVDNKTGIVDTKIASDNTVLTDIRQKMVTKADLEVALSVQADATIGGFNRSLKQTVGGNLINKNDVRIFLYGMGFMGIIALVSIIGNILLTMGYVKVRTAKVDVELHRDNLIKSREKYEMEAKDYRSRFLDKRMP